MDIKGTDIFDLIQKTNQIQEWDITAISALEDDLQKKITSRYSGLSGAILRIYDWLIGNNKTINNTKTNIQNRKTTLLLDIQKNQTEKTKKLSEQLTQIKPKPILEQEITTAQLEKDNLKQKTEIDKLQKENIFLNKQLNEEKQKQKKTRT